VLNTDWGEGPFCRDVVIRGNTFRGVPRSVSRQGLPAISCGVRLRKGGRVARPVHRDVTIRDNTFVDLAGASMSLTHVAGLRITGNRTENRTPNRVARAAVINISRCEGVVVDGERIVDRNPETTAGLAFSHCPGKVVKNLSADLRKGCPPVKD
jgi:hypothetical protein